ncbi:CDP-diacylglycerol--glycerol-3-phosphate 3-phosphatidyltransferase, partial [Streptococcus suis]
MKKENIPNALKIGRILVIPIVILLLTGWNSTISNVLAALI